MKSIKVIHAFVILDISNTMACVDCALQVPSLMPSKQTVSANKVTIITDLLKINVLPALKILPLSVLVANVIRATNSKIKDVFLSVILTQSGNPANVCVLPNIRCMEELVENAQLIQCLTKIKPHVFATNLLKSMNKMETNV